MVRKGKVFIMVSLLAIFLFGMSACGNSSDNDTLTNNQSEPESTSQSTNDSSQSNGSSTDNASTNSDSSGKGNDNEQASNSSDGHAKDAETNSGSVDDDSKESDKEDKETLSKYSSEQIEYARIWLQLGPNQELDELNVKHIPKDTPLNPEDDTKVGYPEDVIQLFGSRIVDGIVTYSGNGDGTINVYNVPHRWYGGLSRPDNVSLEDIQEEMKDIIKNTKLVYVDPGDDEEVIALIKLLHIIY